VPAYTFPENRQDLAVLRIVCRNGFSRDLAEAFLIDLRSALVDLRADGGSATGKVGFHH
jgi:glutamate decarboxylase